MNSAVITKIEYRIFPEANFSALDIIPQSGKLSEPLLTNGGGNSYYDCQVPFTLAKSEAAKDTLLKSIAKRKAQYRLSDANGVVYLVGDESYPARLTYTRNLDGQPGSFNGYRCVITCKTLTGITITN